MLDGWPWILPWEDPPWIIVGNLLFWPGYFTQVWARDRWERHRRRRRANA